MSPGGDRVRVAILGQANWSRHLARLLQRHAPDLVDVVALPGSAAATLLWRWPNGCDLTCWLPKGS